MHRLWSMLTDFSGNEGGENLMCCFVILGTVALIAPVAALIWWLA